MPRNAISMFRVARVGGWFILDAGGALLGTAIAESSLYRIFPVHSAADVLLKESSLSVLFAALIGFAAFWKWRSKTSKMVWILFVLWFGFGVVVTRWAQLSGAACSITLSKFDCQTFFLFTVPLIRGLSYSCGALLASWIYGSHLEKADAGGVQE
jgi:hypothetical protein